MNVSGSGLVADGFNVMPVRTDSESGIAVHMVVRARLGCTTVHATRCQDRAMDRVDLLAAPGSKRQVKMRWLVPVLVQAK